MHILLQDLTLGGLRITKVHHLIEKFVDDDKVIANAFLFQLLEIFRKDFNDLVQKKKDLGRVRISFGKSEQIEIVMSDVEILSLKGVSTACD